LPLGATGGAPPPLCGAAVPGSKPGPSRSGLTVSVVAQPAEALAPIWGVARRLRDQHRPQPVGPGELWGEERSFKRQSEGGGAPVPKRQQTVGPAARPAAVPSTMRRGAALAAAAAARAAMTATGAATTAAGMRAVVAAKPRVGAAAAAARLSAPAVAGMRGANYVRPAHARANAQPREDVYPGALRRGAAVGGGAGQPEDQNQGQLLMR
jgi:hypothetical protein